MLTKKELKKITYISYLNYKKRDFDFSKNYKFKRLKDKDGFSCDLYFNTEENTLYVSFKGINNTTLSSKKLKNNMKTGAAYQYAYNFYLLKLWINIFVKKYSKNIYDLKIYSIGHSMGGALAQMFVSDLLFSTILSFRPKSKNIKLVTFNSLGGVIGNYFLNTELIFFTGRNKKYLPIVKRLWKQIETYHFAHKNDIVIKILEHENKNNIYFLDHPEIIDLKPFYGNKNAHDMDLFFDMIKNNKFKTIKQEKNIEQFNLDDFLSGWQSIVALFYILVFKTENNNIFNIRKIYNSFLSVKHIRTDVIKNLKKIKTKKII